MSEKTITTTQCDICGKTVEQSFTESQIYGWEQYHISKDWRSGAHSGEHDLDIMVCDKCAYKSSTMHFILGSMKKLVGK